MRAGGGTLTISFSATLGGNQAVTGGAVFVAAGAAISATDTVFDTNTVRTDIRPLR